MYRLCGGGRGEMLSRNTISCAPQTHTKQAGGYFIPEEMLDLDVEALCVITVESGLVQAIVALSGRSFGRLSEIR
jgi:hypothetical protein